MNEMVNTSKGTQHGPPGSGRREKPSPEVTSKSTGPQSHQESTRRRARSVTALALPYVAGISVAVVLATVGIAVTGKSPVTALSGIITTSLGSISALAQTIQRTTPLLLGSTAVAFGLRSGYVNLGVDGQIYSGAIAATGLGYALGDRPSTPFAVTVLLVGGLLAGAGLAGVAAVLRVWRGVNEIFVTVMLNFVALYFTNYLASGPWQDQLSGEALSRALPYNDALPSTLLGSANIGILFAVPLALLAHLWLSRTRRGYEHAAVGANPRAARFGGINLASVGVWSLVVGGAFAGLAGAIEVTGVYHRLIVGISPGFGLSSILIAVIARRNILAVIPVSFLFAALVVGSDSLERSVGLPASAGLVFQGLVVLCILFFDATQSSAGRRPHIFRQKVHP